MDKNGYPYSTSMMTQTIGYSASNSVYSWHTGSAAPATLHIGPSLTFARA